MKKVDQIHLKIVVKEIFLIQFEVMIVFQAVKMKKTFQKIKVFLDLIHLGFKQITWF